MKTIANDLVDQLQSDVRKLILQAGKLKMEEPYLLQLNPAEGKWNVIQVLAHLNSYGRFYLPAIETSMAQSNKRNELYFKSGWFGNYFTKLMKPGEDGKIGKKMKSPEDHRPTGDLNSTAVLDEFLSQQHQLLSLLETAKGKNIGQIRVPISISKLIKLKLGDTFRFLIAHEERHFVQIGRTLEAVSSME
jgi:hypothetical protein